MKAVESPYGKPNDDCAVRKADTVRVMVAPELLSDKTSSEWARVDVELPRRHSWLSKATAHDLRQSLVAMAPLRPELPFRLYGGRNPRVDERRLNSARGDALLSACGIEAGTVLWCSPDPIDDDGDDDLPGKDQRQTSQSQALTLSRSHIIPPGREITPIHGGSSPNELRTVSDDAYPMPRSPRSNLPRLQFTDGQGEVVGVLSYVDCEANQYSLGAISACTGMSSAHPMAR